MIQSERDGRDRDAGELPAPVEPFSRTLSRHGLGLRRGETTVLQVNVGPMCNQSCGHCHLEAGPGRVEMMGEGTLAEIAAYARRCGFGTIDITGGAPELHPLLPRMIRDLSPLAGRLLLRCNLTAIGEHRREHLMRLCRSEGVVIVASLPSLNASQTQSQRGAGVFEASLSTLRKLNALGYGREGTGLELDLVSNPTGAFLPGSQREAERRFKRELERRWGVVFNHLLVFCNVPLGRFRQWLEASGNYAEYMRRMAASFNPLAVDRLMCRSLVSVRWDGVLFDCDFNLAAGLHLRGERVHVSEMAGPPQPGAEIATSDHCYACTAGSGFT